jgi:hypothetical protein
MMPRFNPRELRQTSARQYVLRFFFGGTVSVIASLIATRWGPVVGGLFLAFPAVLPASLTFIKDEDGRRSAADDASGARMGAIALVIFAAVIWFGARRWPAAGLLSSALILWFATSVTLWWAMTTLGSSTRGSNRTALADGLRRSQSQPVTSTQEKKDLQ